MGRRYSDEQLAEIAQPYEQHALQALRDGDLEDIRKWLTHMARGHAGLDALGCHSLARKAGKLRQDFGGDEARAALVRIGGELIKTWVWQYRSGEERAAIADLVSVYKHQFGARLKPLQENDDEVVLELAPCGSGGRLERQGLPDKHPAWYGGWSDGVSSYCQACKACQSALNEAVGETVWTTEKGADGYCRMRFGKVQSRGEALFDAQARKTLVQTRVQQAEEKLDAGNTAIEHLLRPAQGVDAGA